MIDPAAPQELPADRHGDVSAVLLLDQCDEDAWQSVNPDTNLGGEAFGGQYLGLAVKSAMLSAPGRIPHVLTSFFLRSAAAARPLVFQVERTRDGRAFAHRRVTALQDGKEVFRAEVSFHASEDNEPAHQTTAPAALPAESLPPLHQSVRELAHELSPVAVNRVLNRRTFDTHFIDPLQGLVAAGTEPEIAAWVRPNPPPPAGDAVAYYATLAYLTDACANFAARTMHSPNLHDGQMMSASLNHAIWFHAPAGPLERFLYVMDSPFAGGGLGLSRGTLFDVDGRLIASMVQEALIRRQVQQ